jgi:signal transduction histidine kinase
MQTRSDSLPFDSAHAAAEAVSLRVRCRHWLVALAVVAVAFAVRWFASPFLGHELPFFGFIAASLIAAWYGGAIVGVSALLSGLFLGEFFFTGPHTGLGITDHVELVRMLRYLGTATLGIFLIEVLHRGQQRLREVLTQREAEIQRRKQSEKLLADAQLQLSAYANELEHRVAERTARLQQSVNSLENVLYHVAHDLRAPIRALSGFGNLLLTEHGSHLDAAGADYCRRLSDAAQRMDSLTSDLLAYGRLASADMTLGRVDLDVVVAAAVRQLAPSIQKSKARLTVASGLGVVRADSRVLTEMLVELLTNALKFVGVGVQPHSRISSEALNGRLRLCIHDNGIGVDAKFQRRIFGLFDRVETAGDARSTGVGLALVAKGMERMGGEVGLQSHPGHGSCFWLELSALSA